MKQHSDDKKPVIEYIVKITLSNGETIEKSVPTISDFPSLEDFDLSIRDGFLEDFDRLEKTILETSRKLNCEISKEFLGASSKKTENPRKNSLSGSRSRKAPE
ncbi:MAG: hypothetical protein Q4E89_05040 [Eubacteriales bacterium]|nr:hypothetical protein [Eubacteriales bacterium]